MSEQHHRDELMEKLKQKSAQLVVATAIVSLTDGASVRQLRSAIGFADKAIAAIRLKSRNETSR